MTITIDLPPDIEPSLRERAGLAGQDIDEWLLSLARREAMLPAYQPLTAEEFDRLADELADTVGPEILPLPDEAMSRENMYGDRG